MVRDPLFGSDHLPEVLAILTASPGEMFTVSWLVAHTAASKDAVQRALARGQEAELVERVSLGKADGYSVNTASPIYPELKALLAKTHGLGRALRHGLPPDGVASAFIFGSAARADDTAQSDVDLMVVGSVSRREACAAVAAFQDAIRRPVQVLVRRPGEMEAARRGTGDPFLSLVLNSSRIDLPVAGPPLA